MLVQVTCPFTLSHLKNGNQYLGFSKTYFSLQVYMDFGDTNKISYSSRAGCAEKTAADLCEEEQ